jgi:type II secretory pathway pseudopilin PulG
MTVGHFLCCDGMSYRSSFSARTRQDGFSYVGVMFVAAAIAIAAAASVQVGAAMHRINTESELLKVGSEYRNALLSYAIASPSGQSKRPKSLNDLLKDPRFPYLKRHLREIYPDPISGSKEWGIVMSADGSGIIGVHSLLNQTPIKTGNFAAEFESFTGKNSYQAWVLGLPD